RGVIRDGASTCVLCGVGSESADHLFGSCNQISPVWYDILRWLGVELVPHHCVLRFFEAFLGMSLGVGYPPYFMLEPIEFVRMSCCVLMGQGIGGPLVALSYLWLILAFLILRGILLLVVVPLR
ncbi:hypothetical protein A2U01_0037770, partial [Trifolium medium]|nr:hypothetical protein [Trifolium medium]